MLLQLSGLLLSSAASLQGVTISGHVVDTDDQPISGARVVVACQPEIPWFEPGREVLDATSSAADGAFELELHEEWLGRQAYKRAEFFVYSSGHRLHAATWSMAELPVGHPLEVTLERPEAEDDARIRVLDEFDAPVVGAFVVPAVLTHEAHRRLELPPEVFDGFEARTNAEGWVTLSVPRSELAGIQVAGEGVVPVRLQVPWGENGPFPDEVRVYGSRPWTIDFGQLEDPPRLRVRSFVNAPRMEGLRQELNGHAYSSGTPIRLPAAADFARAVHFALVGGPEVLRLSLRTVDGSETVRVEVGEDPYEVALTVVDADTGALLEGAELYAQMAGGIAVVRTDESGSATFESVVRQASVFFVRAPEGYVDVSFPDGLNISRPRSPDGPSRIELGPYPLLRKRSARGRVVDAGGKGVSRAWIVAEVQVSEGSMTRTNELGTLSGADGSFFFANVPMGARCEVVARSGDFEARGTLREGEPLELVLEGLLCARGTLLDEAGRPIAGAEVEVWKASPQRLIGGERRVSLGGAEHVVTDANGRFETPAVMRADQRYGLRWRGATVEYGGSEWARATELGRRETFVGKALYARRGVLRGPDGAPLAGAKLRLRTSARTVETDAEGRFELQGLPESGGAVAIQLADGTRRGGVLTPSTSSEDWQLPQLFGEPGEAPPPAVRALELELAHGLLSDEFEAAVQKGDESLTLRAARRFARVDPAAVLARTEEGLYETPWMRDFTLSYVADALEQQSPEEALAVTTRLERGMSRALSTLDAARQLAPAAEREQLALVRADARTISPPEHRVVTLARLAERLLQLGEDSIATEVLDEARAVAADLPTEEWPGYARCVLGEVLARVDLEAGLALIDGFEPAGDRGRHYGNVAHRIASSNPAEAERLLSAIDSLRGASWRSSRWRARVVHAMAPADRERAERIASADASGYSDAVLALALEEVDPDAALAALERAFERAIANGAQLEDWAERPSGVAALLPLAARLEPERIRAWVERALSLHRPEPQGGRPPSERTWTADATIAVYVAPFDPALARALIEPAVAAYAAMDEQSRSYNDYGAVWAAAALLDPEWAAAQARAAGGKAIGQVGQVLALPPEERDAWIQAELVQLWRPGMDDL